MDLFDDLPSPNATKQSQYNDVPRQAVSPSMQQTSATSLYGDLPVNYATTTAQPLNKTVSLYDDIPSQSVKKTTLSQDLHVNTSGKRKLDDESGSETVPKNIKSVKYRIESYLVERQGEREDMQDAHFINKDFTAEIPDLHPSIYRLSIYGVFDGHGGDRASRFASENLHKNLRDKFPKGDITVVEKDIKKAFIDAYKKTDDDFLKLASKSKPVWKDGTTAILLLLINETMYIANIGDSLAVLCRYKEDTRTCVPVSLSVPHNPSHYDERMRIQKQGGYVRDGRVMGVLEVSRSIGDGQFKKLGVICTPDVKKCTLTDNDRYIVIACDGLWKCFEPKDCVDFVNRILEKDSIKGTKERESGKNNKFEKACNKLANEAVLRFSGDNVTVLLLEVRKGR